MRVAIIGAGLSGLSCAYELKRHGIIPVIYEKNDQVGDLTCSACISLRIFSRHYMDPFKYLDGKYTLKLAPLSNLKRIDMISPSKTTVIKGNLGFITKRGYEIDSLENQIKLKADLPIIYNRDIAISDIKKDYDHIVVATGKNLISKEHGVWTDSFIGHTRYAVVNGNFKTDTVTFWVNQEYSKNAFAYLIPVSEKHASLVLIVNGITHNELDHYWKEFVTIVNLQYPITETRDVEHCAGLVYPLKTADNTYFIGNAGGFTGSFIGIGAINSIESGLIAGNCIAKNTDFNKSVYKIYKYINASYELRKAMNTADNSAFDSINKVLGMPFIKQFVYNNVFFKSIYLANLARLYNKLKPGQV